MGLFDPGMKTGFEGARGEHADGLPTQAPVSRPLFLDCSGELRASLLALAEGSGKGAVAWHRALCACFSRAAAFTPSRDARLLENFFWLLEPMFFRCSEGTLIVGIDQHEDGGQYPVAGEEADWSVDLFLVADDPETMCGVIVSEMEAVLGRRICRQVRQERTIRLLLA